MRGGHGPIIAALGSARHSVADRPAGDRIDPCSAARRVAKEFAAARRCAVAYGPDWGSYRPIGRQRWLSSHAFLKDAMTAPVAYQPPAREAAVVEGPLVCRGCLLRRRIRRRRGQSRRQRQ